VVLRMLVLPLPVLHLFLGVKVLISGTEVHSVLGEPDARLGTEGGTRTGPPGKLYLCERSPWRRGVCKKWLLLLRLDANLESSRLGMHDTQTRQSTLGTRVSSM